MGRREKALRVDLSSNWDAINEWRDFGPFGPLPTNVPLLIPGGLLLS